MTIRKIIPALLMLIMVGVLSCSDSEPLTPKDEAQVAPPPVARTIYITGRTSNCLFPTSQQADVYYMINSGSWTYLASVTSTQCLNLGSFSANDGDVISLAAIEPVSSLGISYFMKTGAGCPSSGSTHCPDLSFLNYPVHTVSGSVTLAMQIQVTTGSCGTLATCM